MNLIPTEMRAPHPLVERALHLTADFIYNGVVERFEESFTLRGGDRRRVHKLVSSINDSIEFDRLIQENPFNEHELLLAFESVTRGLKHEVAVVALSMPGSGDELASLAAVRGSNAQVGLPVIALREINNQLGRGGRVRAVIVHNHPRNSLHELLDADALGPSRTDRNTAVAWFGKSIERAGRLSSEFYLVENRSFRRFILPSVETVWKLAIKLGLIRAD